MCPRFLRPVSRFLDRNVGDPALQMITTMGLDIAKSVFQVTALTLPAKLSFAVSCSVAMCWCSSKSCRHVWSVEKPARRRIIGRANCRHWVTPCVWLRLLNHDLMLRDQDRIVNLRFSGRRGLVSDRSDRFAGRMRVHRDSSSRR
jgi:hypothetical protein